MIRMNRFYTIFLLPFCLYLLLSSCAFADAQSDQAMKDAIGSAILGPAQIELANQANLDLGDDYIFIPAEQALPIIPDQPLVKDETFIGLITSKDQQFSWYILISFYKEGYVKSNDASELNTESLLEAIKRKTLIQNKIDVAKGKTASSVQGWMQEPFYDSNTHQVVWSVVANDGSPAALINYNIYLLGREGYLGLVLTTTNADIAKNIQHVANVARNIEYVNGKKYEDYVEPNRIADYQIYGLITSTFEKNLSFIAQTINFIAKWWFIALIIPLLFVPGFIRKIKKYTKRSK